MVWHRRAGVILESQGRPVIHLTPGIANTIGRAGDADVVVDEPSLLHVHARVLAVADSFDAMTSARSYPWWIACVLCVLGGDRRLQRTRDVGQPVFDRM
jgi:hypothetical protein